MKLNNKGMTLVELIISVALISVVVGFLFKVVLDVKYEKDNPGYASNNQINRAEIIKTIQSELLAYGLNEVSVDSSKNNLEFILTNGNKITFDITSNNKKLVYKNEYKNKTKTWTVKDSGYKYTDIIYEDLALCYVKVIIGISDNINEDKLIDDIEILAKYSNCEY